MERLEWKKKLRKKEREGCIIFFSSFGTLKRRKEERKKSHFDASIIYFKDGLFEHSLESSFNVQLLVLLKKQRKREETKREEEERDGMEGKEKTEERTSCETKMNFVNRNNVMFPFRFFFSPFLPVLSLILVCNPFIG